MHFKISENMWQTKKYFPEQKSEFLSYLLRNIFLPNLQSHLLGLQKYHILVSEFLRVCKMW